MAKLNEHFAKAQENMNTNAKDESLSPLFESNIYSYKNRDDEIKIDVTTMELNYDQSSKVLQNGLNGTIVDLDDKKCFGGSVVREGNAHTFISFEFIENLVKKASTTYSQFSSVSINKNSVRTRVLQFRVQDLEYVIPQALVKYSKYAQSEISFQCGSTGVGDIQLQ